MFNFDEERFLSIQRGAVATGASITDAVKSSIDAGATNLFFLGAGGAGMLMEPAHALLRERSTFRSFLELPAQLMQAGNVNLGPHSIVVMPSLSGTTSESIDVVNYVHERGATVIALTGHADSPVATLADHSIVNFAADDTSSESFFIQALLVDLAVMHAVGELDDLAAVHAELETLPEALLEAKRSFEPRAGEIARFMAEHEAYHLITAAGATWTEAFYYGMCILEEMQWIRTRPVHAADFFHGPFELVEKGVSVILLKGEDAGRALEERVERFTPKITDTLTVIDSADFPTPGLSATTRPLIAHAIHATLLERLSAHLEHERRHPLDVRRYYRRLSY